MRRIRHLPSESRRRGLPPIGVDALIPDGLELAGGTPADLVAALIERRPDGRPLGAMAIEIVAARLIIDRDGALAQLAIRRAPTAAPYAVEFESGASGFRADVVRGDRAELPYRSWVALAPNELGGTGAVVVAIESEAPDWPAAAALLASLRVLARDADARATTEPTAAEPLPLPLVKPGS